MSWGVTVQNQLVPAYFYPNHWVTDNPWYHLADTMRLDHIVGGCAIMNPDSGPGTASKPDYVTTVNYTRNKGHLVIGYVHTRYGARPMAEVQSEVDKYYKWYAVDGIFVDQMSNKSNAADIRNYYKVLYHYIKTKLPILRLVVGNPGVTATTDWQLTTPVADVLMSYENTQANYLAWTPPNWVSSYPASAFAHVVHAVTDFASVKNHSKTTNAGWLYATADGLPNPWDTLAGVAAAPYTLWDAQVTSP